MTSTYAVQIQASVTTADQPTHIGEKATETGKYTGLIAVLPEHVEVDYSEGLAILDKVAQRKLGISGAEFIRRWDAGNYATVEEHVKAQEVAMLLPLVRPVADDAR